MSKKHRRKPPETYAQWWVNFTHKLLGGDNLELLCDDVYQNYPNLSADHLHHMSREVARFISYEFSDIGKESDVEQLNSIHSLLQIINEQKNF